MDISVPATNARVVQGMVNPNNGTAPTYSGYTGAGIILGVVSTGLDTTHQDFRTTTGLTRVLWFWDQVSQYLPRPAGYTYGTEYTQANINTGIQNGTEVSQDTDAGSRGTHITGIAASNGQATANNKNAYRYIGMAPNADLIIVKSFLTDTAITDAVSYIFQKAAAAGKPCVILLDPADASGRYIQRGAHDGSFFLDQALSALTGPGKLIVCPVGDEGLYPIHASVDLAAGGSGTMVFNVPSYSPSTGENVTIEMWHEPTASFQVRVTFPTIGTTAWFQPGDDSGAVLNTADGSYQIKNDLSADTNIKGGKLIRIYVYWSGAGTSYPRAGNYTIEVARLGSATTGRLDAWVALWKLGSGAVPPTFTTGGDSLMQVGAPATGDEIIAVGGYTTRNTWTNSLGQTSVYITFPTIGDYYDPTNRGPRRDGVQCPDIMAPCEGVISAMPHNLAGQITANYKADDGIHVIASNTRQAAAHVAGALALRLEQVRTLTVAQARTYLHTLAMADQYTGATPNNRWGYGKLWLNVSNPPVGVGGRPLIHGVGIKPD